MDSHNLVLAQFSPSRFFGPLSPAFLYPQSMRRVRLVFRSGDEFPRTRRVREAVFTRRVTGVGFSDNRRLRQTPTKSALGKTNAALTDFRYATIRSAVVRRTECRRECNRLRTALQPSTRCCDPRLRGCWQRDRNARAQRRFQRVVNGLAILQPFRANFAP